MPKTLKIHTWLTYIFSAH